MKYVCRFYGSAYTGRSQKFAKGEKEVIWMTEVPSGVQGQSPGEGLGAKPQKPDTQC